MPWQYWFNIAPLALGAGALLYFLLPSEPSPWVTLLVPCIAFAAYAYRHDTRHMQHILYGLCISAGLACATLISQQQQTQFLNKRYFFVPINATVERVILADGKEKLLLRDVVSPDIARDAPLRVRLTARLKGTTLHPGDVISAKATLFPPSRPALPSAYDFTRHFFYQGIEGVGYINGGVTVQHTAQKRDPSTVMQYLQTWRTAIAANLLRIMQQPQAGIAVALTTGSKDAITAQVAETLRTVSLGHMLAISGMHMGIISGVSFIMLRALLAWSGTLALRAPIKQWAAILALLCGAAYLALADFPISAIRAYAMIAIVFAAIICNQQADTLRSLVLAAIGILCIAPHAIMSVSFQLSFCATLALVLTYRRLRAVNERLLLRTRPLWQRLPLYVLQTGLTSFIAGLATMPLVAYHFNHIALYGILANMLALPLLSFIVAPALVLSIPASLFGLHSITLQVAQYGISGIIAAAEAIASIPHAMLHVPPLPLWSAVLLTATFFVLLRLTRWRYLIYATGGIAITLLPFMWRDVPDIMISEDGSAIAVRQQNDWLLLKGTSRNFHVEQWAQALGDAFVKHDEAQHDAWQCDAAGCDAVLRGKHIRVRFDYKADGPLCLADTDILISTFYSDRWDCAASIRVDRSLLERYGAHNVTLGDEPVIWRSCNHASGRQWERCK